jgi:hypothetical protein
MSYLLDKGITKEEMGLLEKEVNKLVFEGIKASVGLGFSLIRKDSLVEILSKTFNEGDTITVTARYPIRYSAINDALERIRKGEI